MYRSLLLQLLLRRPNLQDELLDTSDTLELIKLHGEHQEFTTESLKQMFKEAVNHLSDSTLVCFIDALDECQERQIRDMLSFFQQVSEDAIAPNIQFKVCLSSRHYPHINLDRGLSLILEDQEEHGQDIKKYISSELKLGRSKVAEDIRGRLLDKASGIFMWVVLVVGMLNKAYDRGRTPWELQRKLQDIPDDLNELFRDIIERKGDDDNKDALILCIQWILFARQPLSPKQLYFAVQSGIAPDSLSASFASEIPHDTIERFLLDCSKGLAEITRTRPLIVQFIHESVVDFLLKDNGFAELLGNVGGNFRGVSHERLKKCCFSCIYSAIPAYILTSNKMLPYVSLRVAENNVVSSTSKALFFIEYAVKNVLYHADAAMESGIAQEDFLTSFQLSRWVKLHNVFETYQARHYKHNVSLLYVLTDRGLSSLITTCTSVLSTYLNVEEERYGTPLFAALVTGNTRVVQTFLETHAASRPSEKKEYLRSLCVQYAQDKSNRPLFRGLRFQYSSIIGVLGHLAELGDEILFEFALDIYAYKLLEFHGISAGTPLSYAARNGHDIIVKSLIGRYRANINSQVPIGRTPLSWAAQNGHDNVVQALLNTYNVNVNSQDKEGWTPLAWAASNGHDAIVKSLLERRDVNVSLPDRSGCTPLFVAAKHGLSTTVKLLLERNDVNVNQRDINLMTPLAWAASNGHDTIVKSLLERRDVNVNLPDRFGCTPLLVAMQHGHSTTVRLLLERNDVHVNQRDKYLWTPLTMAAKHGNVTIVKSLLTRHDIHVNLSGQYHRTALYWGVREGHETVVKLLLDRHDIDVSLRDSADGTLLFCAVKNRHGAIVKLLLDRHDIDVNSEDLEGLTPFTLACTERLDDIAKLILDTGRVDPDIVQKYPRLS